MEVQNGKTPQNGSVQLLTVYFVTLSGVFHFSKPSTPHNGDGKPRFLILPADLL